LSNEEKTNDYENFEKGMIFAILSELGRIPFALDCFTSVFKYWYRLDSSTNFLLKSAYIEKRLLYKL
jgi:hypothetical protein